MGFLDSMKKGFETESNKINELKKYSNYKTIKESTDEYYDRLKRQGDSSLLKKMNDIFNIR